MRPLRPAPSLLLSWALLAGTAEGEVNGESGQPSQANGSGLAAAPTALEPGQASAPPDPGSDRPKRNKLGSKSSESADELTADVNRSTVGYTDPYADLRQRSRLFARGTYVHTFGGVGYGRGLRLNNPFRLGSPVGEAADGLSATAPFLDLSLAGLLGPPRGLQHGVVARLSLALTGVPQEVVSFGYVAAQALGTAALGYARLSLPIVLRPDLTAGGELGLGAVFWLRAGLGLSAELSGSVFAGAATWESDPTLIPVLASVLGVCFDYEVLP